MRQRDCRHSRAEGRLNQLTPAIAGTSVSDYGQDVYLRRLRSTRPIILNWWINRSATARLRAGDAASAG